MRVKIPTHLLNTYCVLGFIPVISLLTREAAIIDEEAGAQRGERMNLRPHSS